MTTQQYQLVVQTVFYSQRYMKRYMRLNRRIGSVKTRNNGGNRFVTCTYLCTAFANFPKVLNRTIHEGLIRHGVEEPLIAPLYQSGWAGCLGALRGQHFPN